MKTFDEAVGRPRVGCCSEMFWTEKMAWLSKQGGSKLGSSIDIDCGRDSEHRYCGGLLENLCTSLIKAHARQWPDNRTFCKTIRACVLVCVSYQFFESALWPTSQIAPATSIFSPLRCDWTHFLCRLPVLRFTHWLGVSPISPSLAHSYISVLVTTNTQYPSRQHLLFLSLGAQLIQETARENCWRLVLLDFQCSNPLYN